MGQALASHQLRSRVDCLPITQQESLGEGQSGPSTPRLPPKDQRGTEQQVLAVGRCGVEDADATGSGGGPTMTRV